MPVIAGLSKEGTRLIKTDFSGARWEAFPYLQRIGLSVCFFFCPPFILLSSGPTMDLNRGGRWSPYHTTPYPSAHQVLSNTVLPSLAKLYSTQPNERPQAQTQTNTTKHLRTGKGPQDRTRSSLSAHQTCKTKKVGSPLLYYGQHGVQAKFLQHSRGGEAAEELVVLI